ncbi:hypothetical protein [Pararhizobium sp. LjRoot238]|uniref:hypothetical protein n=1 Tax=Pararhizobium sp. LjRoot238 TaxID=3342293 RepID=UPI003ECD88B1
MYDQAQQIEKTFKKNKPLHQSCRSPKGNGPMSTQTANTASETPNGTPAVTEITFNLTATNESSVPGTSYFSVFPPKLTNPKSQILTALVSGPTTQKTPTTTLTWQGGSGALTLLALAPGTLLKSAQTTPVSLGDSVAVAWSEGAFTFTPTTGGPADGVDVTFSPGILAGSFIGLIAGPAPILVPIPGDQSPLSLEPDLSQTVTVIFGTPFQFPKSDQSDVSKATTVSFTQDATSNSPTANAQITVGLDNLIVEIG